MSEKSFLPSEQPPQFSGGAGMEVETNHNEQLSSSTDVEEDSNQAHLEAKQLIESYLQPNSEHIEIVQPIVSLNDHIPSCQDDDGDALLFSQMSKHLENIKNLAMKEEKNASVEKQNAILQGTVASSMFNKEQQRADQMMQQKQNELNAHAQMQKEEFEMRLKSKELSLQQREQELRESEQKINFLQNRLASKEVEIVELVQLSQKLSNSLDEQKKIFEKKLWKVQEDQDYTGQVNGEWKGQLTEQKILTEDLTRKVLNLESRIARERKDADSLAEKNFSLVNQNQDLQAENESLKSQVQLLNAEKRQKDSIFDEYGSQQNQFISVLATYQKDLKDVFMQINTNPIIERYKRQNDELIIENSELRNQILKFTEEMDQTKNIEGESKAQSAEKFEQDVNCALEVYQSMMAKFTEMDERMVQNDNEKFEALQQKDFWFSKAQNLEADLESAKEQVKVLQNQQEQLQAEISKLASKKIPLQTSTNNKNKKKQNNSNSSNNKIGTNNSDIEEDITQATTPITEKQFKVKVTDFEETLLTLDENNTNNTNNNTTTNTNINSNNTSSSNNNTVSTNQMIIETQPPKQQQIHTPQPAGPLKNIGLFQLRVCISCFLTIKKMQMFENCQNCHKDYHTKCKGDSIIGAFCNSCYEKQKKKAEIETEKPPISISESIKE